jgi:hypothetical protein
LLWNKDFKVARRGRISKKYLDKILKGKLDKGDVLCSDDYRIYGAFTKNLIGNSTHQKDS